MKYSIFTLIIISFQNVFSQNIETRILYPDTLFTINDTFYVSGFEQPFVTYKSDTINIGTDGLKGKFFKVWTHEDMITIPYVNAPYEQFVYMPIASLKDTTLCRLAFYRQTSDFSEVYTTKSVGEVTFQIPEVYELANVILYLTECSELTKNHPIDFEYSKRVNVHFNKFRDHPLIRILNDKCLNNQHWTTYYGFRENSICFMFDEDDFLSYTTPYKHAWWDNSEIHGGEFRNLLYLVQDFVDKTDFRSFYKHNANYYKSLEIRQEELQPIRKMWKWLEKEFPQKYDHYKVILSPLIERSHSTQKFYKEGNEDPEFQECIMFVNSSESIDSNMDYDEDLKVGLSSGIVFTEIDHNYVNPTSRENLKGIKNLFSQKDKWATKEAQNNYSSEYAIFN